MFPRPDEHRRRLIATLLAVAVPVAVAVPAPGRAALPAPVTAPWTLAPVPAGRPDWQNNLEGVSGLAPNDIWAVGSSSRSGSTWDAQALHFDGARWHRVPTPSPNASRLTDVDAVSATDVWAAGGASGRVLVARLSGGAFVPAHVAWSNPQGQTLNGIDMIGARDGWAVGTYGGDLSSNLVLRWDGVAWRSVPVPDSGPGRNVLTDVVADGPDRAWAVGYWTSTAVPSVTETVILRWYGGKWSRLPSPNPSGGGLNKLAGVTVISPSDAWAVGQTASRGWVSRRPLALHWDGTRWSEVPLGTGNERVWEFTDVAAASRSEVYAVGYRSGADDDPWDLTHDNDFVRRWDGTRFVPETVNLPRATSGVTTRGVVSALSAVTVVPGGGVRAVGHLDGRSNQVLTKAAPTRR